MYIAFSIATALVWPGVQSRPSVDYYEPWTV